jgi:hypothetical protein
MATKDKKKLLIYLDPKTHKELLKIKKNSSLSMNQQVNMAIKTYLLQTKVV